MLLHIVYITLNKKNFFFSFSTFDDLSCDSGESLVDTTLSILKMLLPLFYILDLTGDHVTTRSSNTSQQKIFFLTLELFFYSLLH